MERLIGGGKYKIIEVLTSDDSYEASLCINVMVNNDYAVYIVNTYKSKQLIRDFLPLYFRLSRENCSDFVDLITTEGKVCAVYEHHSGEELVSFFSKHPREAYEEKLMYADALLSSALELDIVDDRIAASALDGNVVVDANNRKIYFNYIVSPLSAETVEGNFRCCRLGELLRAIFPFTRYLPAEIDEFVDRLSAGTYRSCVDIYSGWRAIQEEAEKTRKSYLKESWIKYLIRRAKRKKRRRKQQD